MKSLFLDAGPLFEVRAERHFALQHARVRRGRAPPGDARRGGWWGVGGLCLVLAVMLTWGVLAVRL